MRKLAITLFAGITGVQAAPVLNNVTSLDSIPEPSSYNTRLYTPKSVDGMETDQNSDLYFSESQGNKIFKVNRFMRTSLFAGTGEVGTSLTDIPQRISRPYLAGISGTDWFVIESYNSSYSDILKLETDTNEWAMVLDGHPSHYKAFDNVRDTFADNGSLYYTTTYSQNKNKLFKLNRSYAIETVLGGGSIGAPVDGSTISSVNINFSTYVYGVTGNGSGTFYLSSANRIYEWDSNANTLTHIYGNGSTTLVEGSSLLISGGLELNDLEYNPASNSLYFIEESTDSVGVIDLTAGTVVLLAGNGSENHIDGKLPSEADFGNIQSIELSLNGELFIYDIDSDSKHNTVAVCICLLIWV